jgi:hypothetical protein
VHLDHLNLFTDALGKRLDEPQRRKIEPAVADGVEQLDRAVAEAVDGTQIIVGKIPKSIFLKK